MSTAIMGIPPEETRAFKTDIEYRLGVLDAMDDVLGKDGIDEVILTYSIGEDQSDGPRADLGEEGLDFAMNPGTVADFLRSQGVGEDLIEYVMSFSDNQVHGKLANAIRRAPKDLGHAMTLAELKKIGELLRPKELTPLELALYEVVREEKNLTAWLGREIRLIKKEYGDEINNADIIQFLYPLQSIKDWYIANDRPSGIQHLSFKAAHDLAVEWEHAQAGLGAGLYYGPVKPENILYLDPKTGFSVQLVDNLNDLKVEGAHSRHCVARYWDEDFNNCGTVQTGGVKILSLRDSKNIPHITIELDNVNSKKKGGEPDWQVMQIKGFANQVPDSQFRVVLARYFTTISGLRYVHNNRINHNTLGFRSLAIDSAVGSNRWAYTSASEAGHGRPADLTDEETAAIIIDHAKNISAVLLHAKRYSFKVKKGTDGLRFEDCKVGLDIRTQKPDAYGIMEVTEKREETMLNAAIFGGDLRVYLGDPMIQDDGGHPVTRVLKEAIDIFIDVIVETNKIESKLHNQWKKVVVEYIKKQKAMLSELKKIGPENLKKEHFNEGLLKEFLEEQGRPEHMEFPSYANQVFLLEKNIKRAMSALHDRRYWASISKKIVDVIPFDKQSFSECAQEMMDETTDSKDGNPHGRWTRWNAMQYFSATLFEKINGCPLFAEAQHG